MPTLNEAAKAELTRIIKDIPAEKRGQVNTSVTLEGVRAEASWYFKPNWSFAAYGEKAWKGGKSAGLIVKGNW